MDLAKKFNCTFIETSAYNGENVQEVFEQLATEILQTKYHINLTTSDSKNLNKKGSLKAL